MRRRRSQSIGLVPKAARNVRVKCDGLMPQSRARSLTVWRSKKFNDHRRTADRRLMEHDLRMVQFEHPDWNHHSRLTSWRTARCSDTDQATAALITDLKRRGLLDDTLVVWGGEFGRSPVGQGTWDSPEAGRDHHPRNFTNWMAGGGVKPGITYGATDDFGFNAVENPVHVRDLHATILHLMGIDHARFSVRASGLDQKVTGVEAAAVVTDILH